MKKVITFTITVLLLALPANATSSAITPLQTPLTQYFCTGWLAKFVAADGTRLACDEVGSYGEHGKMSDRTGDVSVRISAPEAPSSTKNGQVTVYAKDDWSQIHIRAGFYEATGLYNTVIVDNSYATPVSPSVNLASFNTWINSNSTRAQYCAVGKCKVQLDLTSAQATAVGNWENSGLIPTGGTPAYSATHLVMVDVVVDTWYVNSNSIGLPHKSFHYVLTYPAIGGGDHCGEIVPASPGSRATPILFGALFLVFIAVSFRIPWLRYVIVCVLLSATVSQASNIVSIGSINSDILYNAAANGALNSAINTMMTNNHITSSMIEGQTMMTGTPTSDGCSFPTITFAASADDGTGLQMVPGNRFKFVVDPNCQMWISFADEDPDGAASTEFVDEGPMYAPVAFSSHDELPCLGNFGCDVNPGCDRPFKARIQTEDRATISEYGIPYPFGGSSPSWWNQLTRLPATELSLTGDVTDFGDPNIWYGTVNGAGLGDPSSPGTSMPAGHTVWVFPIFGWTAESGPPGGPPVTPWMHVSDNSVYYVEAVQYWSLHPTTWSEYMFPVPSGFWHQAHIGVWLRPGGHIDMIMEFSGELPNWSSNLSSIPPRLPAVFEADGSAILDLDGVCPFMVEPTLAKLWCGPNYYVYTNTPGDTCP